MGAEEKKCQAVAEKVMTRLKSKGLLASPEKARCFVRFAYEDDFPEIPGRYEGNWFGNTFQIEPATVHKITGRVYWSEDPKAMNWEYRSDWFLLKGQDYSRLTSEADVEDTTCLQLALETMKKEFGPCDKFRSPRAHDRCLEEANLRCSASIEKCGESYKSRVAELEKMISTPRGHSALLNGFDDCHRNVYDAQGKFDPDQTECRANQIVQMIEEMIFKKVLVPDSPSNKAGKE
jgi:hypothetical protein